MISSGYGPEWIVFIGYFQNFKNKFLWLLCNSYLNWSMYGYCFIQLISELKLSISYFNQVYISNFNLIWVNFLWFIHYIIIEKGRKNHAMNDFWKGNCFFSFPFAPEKSVWIIHSGLFSIVCCSLKHAVTLLSTTPVAENFSDKPIGLHLVWL